MRGGRERGGGGREGGREGERGEGEGGREGEREGEREGGKEGERHEEGGKRCNSLYMHSRPHRIRVHVVSKEKRPHVIISDSPSSTGEVLKQTVEVIFEVLFHCFL